MKVADRYSTRTPNIMGSLQALRVTFSTRQWLTGPLRQAVLEQAADRCGCWAEACEGAGVGTDIPALAAHVLSDR